MPSFHRNGTSHINGNGRRRTKVASSSTSTLIVRKCFRHPKLAKVLFVTILFSWVGIVALFLSTLPPQNHNNAGMSPLSARKNLSSYIRKLRTNANAASSRLFVRKNDEKKEEVEKKEPIKKKTIKRKAHGRGAKELDPIQKKRQKGESVDQYNRDHIAARILAKLPYNFQSDAEKGRPRPKNMKEIEENILSDIKDNRAKAERAQPKLANQADFDSLRQSVQNAGDISFQPYVQKSSDAASPPGRSSLYSFAHEDYYNKDSMMHDDDDSLDSYYAMDDDANRGKDYGEGQFCSTPSFYRLYRPTCNELHSTASGPQWLTEDGAHHKRKSRYLGAGGYRQVFLLERHFASSMDEVILKSMKILPPKGDGRRSLEQRAAYNPDGVYKNFELYDDMRKDSMVMELLTSSPRIANIYSFCALSSIMEYAPGNIEKYVMPPESEIDDEVDDPTPVNDNIPPVEKLEMALELAKGLAAMHGHSGGVIANVDVQIGQFCRAKDGLIKILDFNRAEVMMYDVKQEKYCPFSNGPPPDGALRSPEEIIDAPLNEKVDVYSIGNVFYSILTGLFVNRDYETGVAHRRIKNGITEEIDVGFFESRSPAEMALVKVIQWCWTFKADERPSIFQIVEFLEDEVKKNLS